jgi:hypothetical protein
VLVVTGDVVVTDGFEWHGLVVAAPPGRLFWEGSADIYGAVWVAGGAGLLEVDLERGAGVIAYDSCSLGNAYRALPLSPVAFRER